MVFSAGNVQGIAQRRRDLQSQHAVLDIGDYGRVPGAGDNRLRRFVLQSVARLPGDVRQQRVASRPAGLHVVNAAGARLVFPGEHVTLPVEHERAAAKQLGAGSLQPAKALSFQRHLLPPDVFDDDFARQPDGGSAILDGVVEIDDLKILFRGDVQLRAVVVEEIVGRGAGAGDAVDIVYDLHARCVPRHHGALAGIGAAARPHDCR